MSAPSTASHGRPPYFASRVMSAILEAQENLEILARVGRENHEVWRSTDLEVADDKARVGVDNFVHVLAPYRVFGNNLEFAVTNQKADHAIGRIACRV